MSDPGFPAVPQHAAGIRLDEQIDAIVGHHRRVSFGDLMPLKAVAHRLTIVWKSCEEYCASTPFIPDARYQDADMTVLRAGANLEVQMIICPRKTRKARTASSGRASSALSLAYFSASGGFYAHYMLIAVYFT